MGSWATRSGQDLGDDVAVHVGQPAVDAVVAEGQLSWSMPSRCRIVAWRS